jgi:DNA helicase-2/ATP-dependent DNA helicase PcrA
VTIDAVLQQKLDPNQSRAASETARETLSLACAGSGKSRTLAYRIAWLLSPPQNARPESIVAFTFTEKAAETIKRRVADALEVAGMDPTVLGAMYIGTIHAFCQKVLGEIEARYRQFDVLDTNRLLLFLISRYSSVGLHPLRQARSVQGKPHPYFKTIKGVADAWTTMNDEMLRIEDVEALDPTLGATLRFLSDKMERDQFIDFSLMVRKVVDALGGGRRSETVDRLRHLLVDEYQDVNTAEEALIRALHRGGCSLFVVGDDDQSIYGWRGADVSNILTFQPRYGAAQHRLSHNYRSTEPIVTAADRFAAAELGATRLVKNPTASNAAGPRDIRVLWFPTRADEADWVAGRIVALLGTAYIEQDGTIRGLTPADFGILMRSTRSEEQNDEPRHAAFTRALDHRGVRYSLEAGGGAFDRAQVRALVGAFSLLRNGTPDRNSARDFFEASVVPCYPAPDFDAFAQVMAFWGREIHAPRDGARRRVYPQRLVHDLLAAFGIQRANFGDDVMRDLGLFSRIIQDVEAVYLSIDSSYRFSEVLNFLENVAETGYDTSTDDLVVRPDTVSVMTVHKAKGLEFPVVFVVDVEQGRFPGKNVKYDGWLPQTIVQAAINRGSYVSTSQGEARLFYTALTRAERFLHVTGAASLPGGKKARKRSRFALGLSHPEISDDATALPAGLQAAPPVQRIEDSDLPTTFSEIRYYLTCPRSYQLRRRFGFSPPIPELFGFGQTVHTGIGALHQKFPNNAPTGDEAEEVARNTFHLKHVAPSGDPATRPGPYERAKDSAGKVVREYAEGFGADFTRQRQIEARFEIPIKGAVISGSIDLLIREDENGNVIDAEVIDFKAIEAGEHPERSTEIEWTELALQVQLYALAARQVLGENARTGAVHFLKDGQRIAVPVDDDAVAAAIRNVEWAVENIMQGRFPMRPQADKCRNCDFAPICPKTLQDALVGTPPAIHVPGGERMAPVFREIGPA